jgi:putative aminopeptidase FrvX
MTDSTELVRQLIALPGPPGEERAVREWLAARLTAEGYTPVTDAKGNLIVSLPGGQAGPNVLVTAHMDEIALMITRIEKDGKIRVAPSGGVYTWKWGEGPVEILTRNGSMPGVLSYGCIHTNAAESVAEYARTHPLNWERAYLFTGKSASELAEAGVRPGLRVVLATARRIVTEFGPYISSYFLDDRADLAAWLLALEALREQPLTHAGSVTFIATTSEEVGGEGAQFYLNVHPTDICVALEIGPKTPEADFSIDAQPTIWVRDGYAAMEAVDGVILEECCARLGQQPHWQYLSRGGSDASCAASRGFTARPVTLGFPVENSHGYEIMHRDAPGELARLLLEYLKTIQTEG